jgi:hypothetical protein
MRRNFSPHVLIEFVSGVRSERKRHQRIYKVFFVELERGVATFVYSDGEKLQRVLRFSDRRSKERSRWDVIIIRRLN